MTSYTTPLKHRGRQRKLTLEQAAEIRLRVASGETQAILARKFGVDPGTLSRICTGQCYEDATGPVSEPPGRAGKPRTLTVEQVTEIRDRVAGGETTQSVSERFGISQTHACTIANGVQYADMPGPVLVAHEWHKKRSPKEIQMKQKLARDKKKDQYNAHAREYYAKTYPLTREKRCAYERERYRLKRLRENPTPSPTAPGP